MRDIKKLAVIGAGNMGSGIAQKMATEGFPVVLVDLNQEQVDRGVEIVRRTLAEGVQRKIFRPDQAAAIQARIDGTADWSRLASADLVVEAVFEDLAVKREVFRRLDDACAPDAILGTNTSSLAVTELALATRHPGRVVGLHYFYHPAKNRLVEVVPGAATDPPALRAAWALQEQIGKTPIASTDAPGFVVNRFFVPWLNEAVRIVEEGAADIPTVEAACKETFGVGMGPFELMNVTGVPIALHAATTLGQKLGPLYAPTGMLARQVAAGTPWPLAGDGDRAKFETVAERMFAVVFYVAAALVDEGVGTIEDTDIGARVGLRWPRGPFELMNRRGVERAAAAVQNLARRWDVAVPGVLARQATRTTPFSFVVVRSEVRDGVAWLTINRPDAMNALNETVVAQLHEAFRKAAADPGVRGIVIGGAGKAFLAGADIRFFVHNIEERTLDRIVEFTRAGHALLDEIDGCPKPVVARMHGLTLGGGLELALACDRIVASPKATLAFPETGIGIYPGLGGTQRAPRRIGVGLAKWLIYTGHTLDARTAVAIGLVDRVAPAESLDAVVRDELDRGTTATVPREMPDDFTALARLFESQPVDVLRAGQADTRGDEKLARAMKQVGFKAPLALRRAERLIDAGRALPLAEGLRLELEHLIEIFSSADAYEGLSTLGRKRPEFKGR